uniref:NADH-ubiquinone oxidoreductase chain 3 n=1 Tax=Pseudogarypus banksi TaxID=1131925 RepID=H9MFI8_9ARAC|nr:NADH dehydrogenase subunit 3 [Pseudogarypus banksi]
MIFMFYNIMISLLILISFMIFSMLVTKINKIKKEKPSPYECGFEPWSMNRLPFSMKFYMILIIFISFDLELIILLPLMFFNSFFIINSCLINLLFFIILSMSLYWEWSSSLLKWQE